MASDSMNCIEPISINQPTDLNISSQIYIYKNSESDSIKCELFSKNEKKILSLPKAQKHVIAIKLQNVSKEPYLGYLFFGNEGIEEMHVEMQNNNVVKTFKQFELTPASEREHNHQNSVFPINLGPGGSLYIRVYLFEPATSILTDVKILDQKSLDIFNRKRFILIGIYFGLEVLVLLLVPFMFLFLSDRKLLFTYAICHFTLIIHLLDRNDFLYLFYEPLILINKQISMAFFFLVPYFLISLAKALYGIKKLYGFDIIRHLCLTLWAILIIFHDFTSLRLSNFVEPFLIFFYLFSFLIAAKLTWKKRNELPLKSIVFTVGIGVLTLAAFCRQYLAFSGIMSYFVSKNIILFAAMFESIVFFLLLTYIGIKKNRELQSSQIREKELIISKQTELQNERNRIASEMHDDLGGGLTSIQFTSQKILRKIRDPENQKMLENIVSNSAGLVSSMSEIIWAMNSRFDNLNDLIGYIRRFAKSQLLENEIQCSFEVVGILKDFDVSGEKRRYVFLMIKEAIHNIIKHSQADHVNIKIMITDNLKISISDNGVGFTNKGKDLGNGILNMKERIKLLDGTLSIQKNPNAALTLNIPLS